MRRVFGCVAIIAALYVSSTCKARAQKLTEIAAAATVGVCEFRPYQGLVGKPIFILEEYHTSFTTNLQEALALIRLHNKFKIQNVGLEGFIMPDAFKRAAAPNIDRAVASLVQGDV